MKTKNMTTLHLRKSIGRSLLRRGLLFIPLALCCFALSPAPKAFGVTPAPDGGYPNYTTAEGANALYNLTTGIKNTALGFDALFTNTTGGYNTATGEQTLFLNVSGNDNTAYGYRALYSNTGDNNTATGFRALYNNTTGGKNTANGLEALFDNTTGFGNTADGYQALFSNTTGNLNTANGFAALYYNTTGFDNTANGYFALPFNTTGIKNTANGAGALSVNTTGTANTANGFQALDSNTTGGNNIALGVGAGFNLTTGSYNIDIGNQGVAGESNTIRIGDINQTTTFIAGIYGVNEGGTMSAVYINGSNGQLGTQPPPSSRRFKKEIKPMDQTSQAILGLQPVTFQYKSDPTGTAQFGLIAEEVAKVDPDLVVRDADGEIYTVRYEAVNAMLLNEFLKEHRKVENQEATIIQLKSTAAKQEATIAQQQKGMEAVTATLKEQASQIQKVSAQLELSKPAPRTVVNDQ
jgi:trimeric autotransporter adhesin